MNYEESIKYYQTFIETKIDNLRQEHKYVYHVCHPFQINLEGPCELYNPKLEETLFEYNLANLILKYFKTTNGFSDALIITDEKLLEKIFTDDFKLRNTKEWYSIKRNGKFIEFKNNPEFYNEFHKLAHSYYKKEDESDFFSDDSLYYNTTWEWTEISWKALINKYSMKMEEPIRFSSFQKWFHENGTPKNLKYPKEWLNEQILSKIKNRANDKELIEIIINHDAYVTLIGSNTNQLEKLTTLNLEFSEEHNRTKVSS